MQKWVLILTIKQKSTQRGCFLFGGDGGISASLRSPDCFRQPKIFRKAHIFGASGTHPVGSHPHHKTKKLPKREFFVWRRWWDSNPRARLRTKRFRVVLVMTTSIHLHMINKTVIPQSVKKINSHTEKITSVYMY